MKFYVEPTQTIYLLIWIFAIILSCCFIMRNKNDFEFLNHRYWAFLFEPWKIITFFVSAAMVTIAAPYSDDPTWDYPDSVIISIATYVFAPWSIAIIYRSIKDRVIGQKFFVALSAFFVPCWTYDLYILLRDNIYPPTWYHNLYLSGPIVMLAGLFWNILWVENEGITFAFMRKKWPASDRTPFKKIFWILVLLGVPVAASIGWFVITFFIE